MDIKPSYYNLFFAFHNSYFIYNTYHSTLAEIEPKVSDALQMEDLDKLDKKTLNKLQEGGFIIPVGRDEYSEYLKFFKRKTREPRLTIKLMLSTSCNCDCVYCYQKSADLKQETIGMKEVGILGNWIVNEIDQFQIEDVDVELFGGEPLLASNVIPELYNIFNRIMDNRNIPFHTSIITNGTLLTDDLVNLIVTNNVLLKVTIDGVGEVHNQRRRILKSSVDSYKKIISNLKHIIDVGRSDLVEVRMNLDRQNISEVSKLASELHTIGVTNFYCGRVLFRGKKTSYDDNIISDLEFDKEIDWKLFELLREYGFVNSPSILEIRLPCQFYNKFGYVVSPSLNVAKCDELVDIKEHEIGYINNDGQLVIKGDNYSKQISLTPDDFEECKECKLLPLCGSGCPIVALNEKENLYTNSCSVNLESVEFKLANIIRAINTQ